MMILNLGCGGEKIENAIGIDIRPLPNVDVVHDLNVFPYPFSDNQFDIVICKHVLEHLDNLLKVMKELHRVTKPNGKILITVPHFSHPNACRDLTHRHFFTFETFNHFTGLTPPKYLDEDFEILTRKFIFPNNSIVYKLISKIHHKRYERHLCHIFPAKELYFELQVIKD
jgi:ubiquinone/menaquinone biosynthesis C-methylase UbiE